MDWAALSFDGYPRALLHIVARARFIPAMGHRPVGPRYARASHRYGPSRVSLATG